MKRLLLAIIAAAAAVAWWRSRVPTYDTLEDYLASEIEREGDALPPDPYTEAIARRLAALSEWTAGSAATYELRPWRTTYCAADCGCAGASLAFLCLFNPECARCHERVWCE